MIYLVRAQYKDFPDSVRLFYRKDMALEITKWYTKTAGAISCICYQSTYRHDGELEYKRIFQTYRK